MQGVLNADALDDDAFAQCHLAERVAAQPSGVPDAGENVGRVRDAVTKADVALLVHRRTAHPAVHLVVRSVRALLVQRILSVDSADLVPTDTPHSGTGLDRLIGGHALIAGQFTVR